jgi:hypothetical protein
VPLCKRGRLGLPPGGPSGHENAQNASAAGNDVSAANNAPEIRNASTEKSGGLINNHASPFVANTMSIHWRPPPAFHNTIFLFRRTGPERGPQSAKLEREQKKVETNTIPSVLLCSGTSHIRWYGIQAGLIHRHEYHYRISIKFFRNGSVN